MILIVGLAVLAGGQVWALKGSLLLGGLASGLVLGGLAWLCRGLLRRERGVRFIGEVGQRIHEADFTQQVREKGVQKARVQKQVHKAPGRVAGSIRAMLAQEGKTKSD
jgi:hypothetical protein